MRIKVDWARENREPERRNSIRRSLSFCFPSRLEIRLLLEYVGAVGKRWNVFGEGELMKLLLHISGKLSRPRGSQSTEASKFAVSISMTLCDILFSFLTLLNEEL